MKAELIDMIRIFWIRDNAFSFVMTCAYLSHVKESHPKAIRARRQVRVEKIVLNLV